jgi:hypothetical protein
MGIVSFCPQGHRVKVKDALAGKKGICPTCGARFRIPLASVEPPAPAAAGGEAAPLPLAAIVSLEAATAERLPRAVPLGSAAAAVHDDFFDADHDEQPAAERPAPIPTLHPLIAERPDLVWCHAEPGGTASEPLGAEAMQAWLSSGRPAAGALVWRADWAEWRPLAAAFPEHAGR